MTGGLINILSYGANDLYLTGAPQITMFKMVYRRYTNFAKESVAIPLGNINFGKEINIPISHIGDLISNTYIQLDVPEINILKTDTVADIPDQLLTVLTEPYYYDIPSGRPDYISSYTFIKKYMTVNMAGYRKAVQDAIIINQSVEDYIQSIIDTINVAITEQSDPDIIPHYASKIIEAYNYEIQNGLNRIQYTGILNYRYSDIKYIVNNILQDIGGTTINMVLAKVVNATEISQQIVDYYFENAKSDQEEQDLASSLYAKFAWNEKLGFAIIDYVTVYMGGETIDKHYGNWMNVWYELTTNIEQQEIYNKMIGNVSEMVTYDRNAKPTRTIYIPLSFCISSYSATI